MDVRLPRALRALVLALAVLATPAHADDGEATVSLNRAVIDQVDLQPSVLTGQRLRITLSALTLQGQRLDLSEPKSIKAFAGSSEIKAPYLLGTYAGTGSDTAIVIVVQASLDYAEVLPAIADALEATLISTLPDRTQIAVMSYGESLGATSKLGPPKAALAKLRDITQDGSTAEPVLLDTLERALPLLKRAKTEPPGRPLRKMIVVLSDGRDLSGDRDRVTRLGVRADKEGVRIHTFGYSPKDLRRPLLTLGELSKRSHGTFRWLRRADSWAPNFTQLADEINKQYVVTYYLGPDDLVAGKKLRIQTTGRTEVASANEPKIPASSCYGKPCEVGYCAAIETGEIACMVPRTGGGRGILGWILMIVGIGVGAMVLLGVVGWLMMRRQQQQQAPMPGIAPPPPGSVPPGVAPPASKPPKVKKTKADKQAASAPPPAAATATTGPRLYILTGPRAGETVPLRHGFMIGKAANSDLVIDDGYTSSQHAQIGMDHFKNCRLFDHNSTNGTYVNGVRVTEYVLQHGMTVRIGSTELRFLAE